MSVQYSRGCPFDCEFCDIVVLNGRKVRTKSKAQTLEEFDALYNRGWRGVVFVVDDNFIANKKKLSEEILPAVAQWQRERKHPFRLMTQASINLSDDERLIQMMVEAGFDSVFIGIESPNEESLIECNKRQNISRDLVASVRTLQNHGLQVQAGFILGFDNDPASVFRSQISFVEKTGIVVAMVGLLHALPGTKLHQRMKNEDRLVEQDSGDNTDASMNFVPRMDRNTLVDGYKLVLSTIYSPRPYYARVKTFLEQYRPGRKAGNPNLAVGQISAFLRSVWFLGVTDRDRWQFWRFFGSTLFKRPRSFSISITLAVYGYHFRRVVRRLVRAPAQGAVG
jgi:radical SAM superfamily enzyme YgiQ (UPF0313 family)